MDPPTGENQNIPNGPVNVDAEGLEGDRIRANARPEVHAMSKLTSLHSLLPVFDSESNCTVTFFINSFEKLAESLGASEDEKLFVIKSKIRGPALDIVIRSSELSDETNYREFKRKFLEFFEAKVTLAYRQQLFSNCKMTPSESIKQFSLRVVNVSQRFLGKVDLKDINIKKVFDQLKLSKMIEGVIPKFKKVLLGRDPQTFEEAVQILELIELNDTLTQDELISNIASNRESGLEQLIKRQEEDSQQTIAALSRQVDDLKIDLNKSRNEGRLLELQRDGARVKRCEICKRDNHIMANCWFKNNRETRSWNDQRGASHNRSGSTENRFASERRSFSSERPFVQSNRGSRQGGRQVSDGERRRVTFQSPQSQTPRFENRYAFRGGAVPNGRNQMAPRLEGRHFGDGNFSGRNYNRVNDFRGNYNSNLNANGSYKNRQY